MKTYYIIAVLWVLGLVMALMPVPQEQTLFFLSSIVCTSAAFLCALQAIWNDGSRLSHSPLIAVGLGFWAVAFASVICSEVKLESYLYFCFFSALPLSFLIFSLPTQNQSLFKSAIWGGAMVLVALSLINLYFYMFAPAWLHHGQSGWPFADPNALAALLSLGFFVTCGVFLIAQKKAQKIVAVILSLLLFAVIVTTGSRAAVVALIGGLVILTAGSSAQVLAHKRLIGFFVAGIVVVAVLMQLLAPYGSTTPLAMLAHSAGNMLENRPAIWHSTWQIIQQHMLIGTGIGTFSLYYPEVRGADYTTAGIHAHCDPLEFWSDMGILAPILFYVFIAGAFIRTVRALKNIPAHDARRIHILVPFCALAAMIAHTHVEFNFYVLPILMVAGALLAYWFQATAQIQGPRIWPQSGISFAALITVFGLIAFTGAAGSSILVQRAQEASARGDVASFARDVNLAGSLSQRHNAQAYLLAAHVPMGLLETGQGDRDALVKQTDGLLKKAYHLNPRSAAILVEQAHLAALRGDEEGSLHILGQAVHLNPLYLAARTQLVAQYRAAGRDKEAYEALKAGIYWPYREAEAGLYFDDVIKSARVFGDEAMAKLAKDLKDQYEGRLSLQAARKNLDF